MNQRNYVKSIIPYPIRLTITIGVLVLITNGCGPRDIIYNPNLDIPPTPLVDQLTNNLFVQTIAPDVNLNDGLTMMRPPFLLTAGGPTPTPNFVSFTVFNHTDEVIIFQNQGFGLRIFTFNEDSNNWQEYQQVSHPAPDIIELPPGLEKYDYTINNQWGLHPDEFKDIPKNEIRLYISGVGEITKTSYGAYLDVTLAP